MTATCQEKVRVDAWRDKTCGRPVKEDGLCGLHLAARRKRMERERKWQEKRESSEALRREAVLLSEALGVRVDAEYDHRMRHTGRFVVPGDWLRKISEGAP